MKAEQFFFKDDGAIPNSALPLLVYRSAFNKRGRAGAEWLEERFAQNNWSNAWRNGVYDYHHYHSITHEVLGVYAGRARLHLGGEEGEKLKVQAGDVIIIPAGVGHKNLGSSTDFAVVGAYPKGSAYDLKTGKESERPEVLGNIADVPLPDADPLLGRNEGLTDRWSAMP